MAPFSQELEPPQNPGRFSAASRQKTVKYLKGGSVQYKRAVILKRRCDSLLVRDLSNKLLMLPVAPDTTEAGC